MRLFLFFLTSSFLLLHTHTLAAIELQELTYDKLLTNQYTDHVQHLKKLFDMVKIKSVLEFGCGYGTKYLLDNCTQVTSVEIVLPDQTNEWFLQTKQLFSGYNNWMPLIKYGNINLQKANLFCIRERKDPALRDGYYLLELKNICDELFTQNTYEMAFVDPGFHMRGDLVNELFDRVSIIVAHDTSYGHDAYGWRKIYTPSNYTKISFTTGCGVTFWIRNDRKDLLLAFGLKESPKARKSLRIFTSDPHPIMIQSLAIAFKHLGHTLVLPGFSFSTSNQAGGLKMPYGELFNKDILKNYSFLQFFSKDPQSIYCKFMTDNIEVIENDEILKNPPDILLVNCRENENAMYEIYQAIQETGQKLPKIIHFSGNNTSFYNPAKVKNLIAVDAYTASRYNIDTINCVFWIPWIDFDNLHFTGFNDSTILNTYIAHYYRGSFVQSASCYYDFSRKFSEEIPNVIFHAYPDKPINEYPYLTRSEIFQAIDDSCATMHIKEREGFGYTIIESIAKGRPVFLKRSWSIGSRLMNWCIEGKTAFFFDDYQEFYDKLKYYLENTEYRHQVQKESSTIIRKIIDNEKQLRVLDAFLQNLL